MRWHMSEKSHTEKTVVLTGSTGAFGRFLAREFLKYDGVKLTLLVRASAHKLRRIDHN